MIATTRHTDGRRYTKNLDGRQARRRIIDAEIARAIGSKRSYGSIVQKNSRKSSSTSNRPSPRDSRDLYGGQAIRGITKPQLAANIITKRTDGSVLHDDGGVILTPRHPSPERRVRVDAADGKAGRDVCGFCRESTETPEIPRDGDVRDEIRRHLLLGAAKFLLWD